jgi:cyclophilin family peptidyl-prolyl cis-trans isomerase
MSKKRSIWPSVVMGLVLTLVGRDRFAIAQTNASSPDKDKSGTYTEELRKKRQQELDIARSLDAIHQNRSEKFGTIPDKTPPELKQAYEASFHAYRGSVGALRRIYWQHQVAWSGNEDLERMQAFSDVLEASQLALNDWRSNIAKVYAAKPSEAQFVREMMVEMLDRDCSKDLYDGLLPIAQALIANERELTNKAYEEIGYVGYANHDFDLAEKAWSKLVESKSITPITNLYLKSIDGMRLRWEDESKQRQADLSRNDNPQVSILTNKGRIIVELFENEAPQAVASFIYLTERKFYDRKTFFRVMDRSGAQSGCDRGDGSGNAGYFVRGEMSLPNHRPVMRGSLLLLSGTNEKTKEAAPDSASSQFVITMLPQPALDGQQTVFGRVIEGMQVLGVLNRLDLSDPNQRKDKTKIPDKIIEARVIRKRDHEYKPDPVGGRLP